MQELSNVEKLYLQLFGNCTTLENNETSHKLKIELDNESAVIETTGYCWSFVEDVATLVEATNGFESVLADKLTNLLDSIKPLLKMAIIKRISNLQGDIESLKVILYDGIDVFARNYLQGQYVIPVTELCSAKKLK